MRIIRTLLILTGVGIALPSPPESAVKTVSDQPQVSGPNLVSSAALTVADLVGFCQRQPEVCQTAGRVTGHLEAKIKYTVRLIYEWANDNGTAGTSDTAPATMASDTLETSSTAEAARPLANAAADGQSTLRLEDLSPAWRLPSPPKKS
jgi:hypothetical protein